MNDEQKNLFHVYEDAKRKIAEYEEIIDRIKPQILEIMPEDADVNSGTAIFRLQKGKASWKYSPELTEIAKEIKDRQKIEEQSGIAEKVHGAPFIVCKLK